MKNVIINEKNNMLVIKLMKNFYKGNKLVIMPISNGFFEIKKDEEDHCYKLYFTSNNNENKIKMALFTFGTFKEAEEIKEDIEKYLIKKEKTTINRILKNILLTTVIVTIPFILINLNEIIITQKMDIFSKMLSANVSNNNIQSVKPDASAQILNKILENKLGNQETTKNIVITPEKNNNNENIEQNKQQENKNLKDDVSSDNLDENTISEAQKEMNEQLKIIKEKREKNVDLEK